MYIHGNTYHRRSERAILVETNVTSYLSVFVLFVLCVCFASLRVLDAPCVLGREAAGEMRGGD